MPNIKRKIVKKLSKYLKEKLKSTPKAVDRQALLDQEEYAQKLIASGADSNDVESSLRSLHKSTGRTLKRASKKGILLSPGEAMARHSRSEVSGERVNRASELIVKKREALSANMMRQFKKEIRRINKKNKSGVRITVD